MITRANESAVSDISQTVEGIFCITKPTRWGRRLFTNLIVHCV